MNMDDTRRSLNAYADAFFEASLGISFQTLLSPIAGSCATGRCVKAAGVHRAIQEARREDDPSLPMGEWERPLKQADWALVCKISSDNLAHQVKDLQIAAWLAEGLTRQHATQGLSAGVMLLGGLLERYGSELLPVESDSHATHKANIVRSAGALMAKALKHAPIFGGDAELALSWADKERADALAQLSDDEREAEAGPTQRHVHDTLKSTPSERLGQLEEDLGASLDALQLLEHQVDRVFSAATRPGFGQLKAVAQSMLGYIHSELLKRGWRAPSRSSAATTTAVESVDMYGALARGTPSSGDIGTGGPTAAQVAAMTSSTADPLLMRQQAYAMLQQAADMLAQIDPHSPTPYLVQRAVEWGKLNTADLYRELFIEMGGQINVFELLGIQTPDQGSE